MLNLIIIVRKLKSIIEMVKFQQVNMAAIKNTHYNYYKLSKT